MLHVSQQTYWLRACIRVLFVPTFQQKHNFKLVKNTDKGHFSLPIY